MHSAKRVYRQIKTDIYVWTRSRWLFPGILLLIFIVGIWSWFEARALLEEVSDKNNSEILARSLAWGLLAELWQGIFETFAFLGSVLGSLALATEYGTGRIRLLISQPFQRNEFYTSRALRSLLTPLILTLVCLGLSLFVISQKVGLGPLVDPDWVSVIFYEYGQMAEAYTRIVIILLLVLLCSTAFGIFVSSLARTGIQSVMFSMFGYLILRALGTYPADWVGSYLFTGVLHRMTDQSSGLASGITGMYERIMKQTYEDPVIFFTAITFLLLLIGSGIIFQRSDLR